MTFADIELKFTDVLGLEANSRQWVDPPDRWVLSVPVVTLEPYRSPLTSVCMYTNVTYFPGSQRPPYISVYKYKQIVHLPEHWFHMVLETGYKHLRHQMKSVSECRSLLTNSVIDWGNYEAGKLQRVLVIYKRTQWLWLHTEVKTCSSLGPVFTSWQQRGSERDGSAGRFQAKVDAFTEIYRDFCSDSTSRRLPGECGHSTYPAHPLL